MYIQFSHNDQFLKAKLVYNFQQIKDCVLVIPDNHLSENIIFYKQDGMWRSSSELQTRHPSTYLNIQKAIEDMLKAEDHFNLVRFQQYLS